MLDLETTKSSSARRRGDAYELHLLALHCLHMVVKPQIQAVWHEHRAVLPADDVIVESTDSFDCFQAKHATDPHGLLDFDDLITSGGTGPSIGRLSEAWKALQGRGKGVRIHLYTNRAAGPALAKLLDGSVLKATFIKGTEQKRLRRQFASSFSLSDETNFIPFLKCLRFDLRQKGLDELRQHIRDEWIPVYLGLPSQRTYERLMSHAETWFLERESRPITKQEVLDALGVDTALLPQDFFVDRSAYVYRPTFEKELESLISQTDSGYILLIGPPGSGKSSFITEYIRKRERKLRDSVIRYYCFTEVNDPSRHERATADSFLKGVVEQIWRQYGHLLPQERRYSYTREDLHSYLDTLGKHFQGSGSKLLMVLDGLDHAARATDVEPARRLLTALCPGLPHGVVFLISAQGEHYVPSDILRHCGDSRTLSIPLFDLAETEKYMAKTLQRRLSLGQIQMVQEQSQGLPLYLHYISARLKESSREGTDSVLRSFPHVDGDINEYHGWLWDELQDDNGARHLCGLLACLRFRVKRHDLAEMAGIDAFSGGRSLSRVEHLLQGLETAVRVYHDSFREFVLRQLDESQTNQINNEIFHYLKQQSDASRWCHYIFAYAKACGDYAFIRENLTNAYIEDAIARGRPETEIVNAICLGIEASTDYGDLALLARCLILLSHTRRRFESQIDQIQFRRTLLALRDVDSVLAAVSDLGAVRNTSAQTAKTLVGLAYAGYESSGEHLARDFLRKQPRHSDDREMIEKSRVLSAAYFEFPRWLLDAAFRDPSALSADVLRTLHHFGRHKVLRVIRRRRLLPKEGWDHLSAVLEAEQRPETAEHHIRRASKTVHDQAKRLRLAGEAARIRCDRDLVKSLLGETILTPRLDNDSINHFNAEAHFQCFRAYLMAIKYCGRESELRALEDYLQAGDTWLSAYYLANLKLVEVCFRVPGDGSPNPEAILEAIEILIHHKKRPTERIFEVFDAVRKDLPEFLEIVIRSYVDAGGEAKALLSTLARWGDSELISEHFGVGLCVADFDNEIAALREASQFPQIGLHLRSLLVTLHDKVLEETFETATRTGHLLKLAEISANCGLRELARQWIQEGICASNGYYYRKDITLYLLMDAVRIVNRVQPDLARQRIADIADWNTWMPAITDGKETKWFPQKLMDAVLQNDFVHGLHLLLTYWSTVAHWQFSDSLAKLLLTYQGDEVLLAYLLSEVINECDRDSGFEDKFTARLHILGLSVDCGQREASIWIAKHLRQFLQCEVPPERRIPLVEKYNTVAMCNQLPTISCSPKQPLGNNAAETGAETLQLAGDLLSRDELVARMSESPDAFAKLSEILAKENKSYSYVREIGEAANRLTESSATLETLDTVAQAITKDRLYAQPRHGSLAKAYQKIGHWERAKEQYKKAFETHLGFGLWDKPVECFLPLYEHDRAETLGYLTEYLAQKVISDEHSGFGAAVLLLRALDLFAVPEHGSTISAIYEEMHSHARSQLSHLPRSVESCYEWLRQEDSPRMPFCDCAWSIIMDEWKQPAVHRRMNLAHLVGELALVQPNSVLPRIIGAMLDESHTIRVQASLALSFVSMQHPDLLVPYRSRILEAALTDHFEIKMTLENLLERLEVQAPTVETVPNRAGKPRIQVVHGAGILLPSGIGPSADFRSQVLNRAGRSVTEMVQEVAGLLGMDVGEAYWRIENRMEQLGYDEKSALEEHDSVCRQFIHPQGLDFSLVPFEPPHAYQVKHAFANVVGQIITQRGLGESQRQTIFRYLRTYDPCFPWRLLSPKPADLIFPALKHEDSLGNLPSDVIDWIRFDDCKNSIIESAAGPWEVVFDEVFHSDGRLEESIFLSSELVSMSAANQIEHWKEDGPMILSIARHQPTTTISEAQNLLETLIVQAGRFSGERVPLLGLYSGRWFYEPYILVGLPGTWSKQSSLKWRSHCSLDMLDGREGAVKYCCWKDGYEADTYQYQVVGRGTRLSVSSRVLERIGNVRKLALLKRKNVVRKVSSPRFGKKGSELQEERTFLELVRLTG